MDHGCTRRDCHWAQDGAAHAVGADRKSRLKKVISASSATWVMRADVRIFRRRVTGMLYVSAWLEAATNKLRSNTLARGHTRPLPTEPSHTN
jgi:hypothetical protein